MRFTQEHLNLARQSQQLRAHLLDGDEPGQASIFSEKYMPHPSFTDLLENLVFSRDEGPNRRGRLRRRRAWRRGLQRLPPPLQALLDGLEPIIALIEPFRLAEMPALVAEAQEHRLLSSLESIDIELDGGVRREGIWLGAFEVL